MSYIYRGSVLASRTVRRIVELGAMGDQSATESSSKFLYFSYGSNMSSRRLMVGCPLAEAVGPAVLKDFRLTFDHFSNRWQGSVATIEPSKGDSVYGVLWTLDADTLKALDSQEGVDAGIYRRIKVEVGDLEQNRTYSTAFTYQLREENLNCLDRRSSTAYMEVILAGAKEHRLPEEYVRTLEGIETNGFRGPVSLGPSFTS